MPDVEIWKDIPNYKGLYQASNLGKIRRVGRKDAKNHFWETKELRQTKRGNYLNVHISINMRVESPAVHRLVALTFCNKPDGCDIVNHLDGNPHNNRADNLEWTTYKGNMQHASKMGRMRGKPSKLALEKSRQSRIRPVIATDINGNEYYFESQVLAAKELGVCRGHIASCCKQQYGYKTSKGYYFRYAEKEEVK